MECLFRTRFPRLNAMLPLWAMSSFLVVFLGAPRINADPGFKILQPNANAWVKVSRDRIVGHSKEFRAAGHYLSTNVEAKLWCDTAIATRRWSLIEGDFYTAHDDKWFSWDINDRGIPVKMSDQDRVATINPGWRRIATDAELAQACFAAKPADPNVKDWTASMEAEVTGRFSCKRSVLAGERGQFHRKRDDLKIELKCHDVLAPTQTMARVTAEQWEFSCPAGFVIEDTQSQSRTYTSNIAGKYLKNPQRILDDVAELRKANRDKEADALLSQYETGEPRFLKCIRPWQSKGKEASGERACPFYYLFDPSSRSFVKKGELIKNLDSYEKEKLDREPLIGVQPVDGKLRVLIREEKAEIAHLDFVALEWRGQLLLPRMEAGTASPLAKRDARYLTLRQGDELILEFDVSMVTEPAELQILSSGYYDRLE